MRVLAEDSADWSEISGSMGVNLSTGLPPANRVNGFTSNYTELFLYHIHVDPLTTKAESAPIALTTQRLEFLL